MKKVLTKTHKGLLKETPNGKFTNIKHLIMKTPDSICQMVLKLNDEHIHGYNILTCIPL